jgi:rod shape-determining protein MreC
MGKLLQLFLRSGGFVVFVLVEAFCFYVVVQFNTEQNAIFSHTVNRYGGKLMAWRQEVSGYVRYRARYDSLVLETQQLKAQLALIENNALNYRDSVLVSKDTSNAFIRPAKNTRLEYHYLATRVVSNSIGSANNFLLIKRGSADSIAPNTAVVSRNGIVGIVRHVDRNFSLVMSVLNRQARISAAVKKYNAMGSLIWEGGDPSVMTLKDIPKHFDMAKGDTIVTSGKSIMFPKNIMIGTIWESPQQDPENPYFKLVKVRLSQDMTQVDDVYVVKNIYSAEQGRLLQKVQNEQ